MPLVDDVSPQPYGLVQEGPVELSLSVVDVFGKADDAVLSVFGGESVDVPDVSEDEVPGTSEDPVVVSPHPYGLVQDDDSDVVPGNALESLLNVGMISVDPEGAVTVGDVDDDPVFVAEELGPYV